MIHFSSKALGSIKQSCLLKHIVSPKLQDKLPEIFFQLKDLTDNQSGLQYLESLIRYLLSNAEDIEINDLKSIVSNTIDQNKGDMVMIIADKLKQEGRQEAMQQGISLVLELFDQFGQSNETKIVASMIKNIYDPDVLADLEKKLEETGSIEDFKEIVFLTS